ncbi:hypothetical protein PDIG_33230 [Penicillium digitatum PHI26]|uniref:Uncharacterized protein n=2 Tax=Penicillium digitatum TaxID=36651 RepID=K9G0C9_PEND2|nr:hypothetical protein PDIP_52820 [Penicillium digitatum Pd1]EKV12325.1 hypothetical protein PDIP_52820 [Penicillium digitatum Pd1]EKV14307.1 hypothetical protein PDIG_33230 [Penicillium digitatum PHI26]
MYTKSKQACKLWVRQQIKQLLDQSPFEENRSVSSTVTGQTTVPIHEKPVSFVPDYYVQGAGLLRGRVKCRDNKQVGKWSSDTNQDDSQPCIFLSS